MRGADLPANMPAGNHDPARNHMTLSYTRAGWRSGWADWKQHLVYAGYSGYSAMQDLSVSSSRRQVPPPKT
jgi:hypothetical protein